MNIITFVLGLGVILIGLLIFTTFPLGIPLGLLTILAGAGCLYVSLDDGFE